MKERPVLFSAPMVLALLAGTKTQTRRIVKTKQPRSPHYLQPMWGRSPPPSPVDFGEPGLFREVGPDYPDDESDDVRCPYGAHGDRLWVKETWRYFGGEQDIYLRHKPSVIYRADLRGAFEQETWKPSIFMSRWASRITLEITNVRVDRLQDISEADAIAEGVERLGVPRDPRPLWQVRGTHEQHESAVGAYSALWESINGADSWAANPWVWCLTFKRVTP